MLKIGSLHTNMLLVSRELGHILLKPDEEIDPFEILDFLNKLQENMLTIVTGVLFTSAVIP